MRWLLAGLGGVLLALLVWTAWSGYSAYRHLAGARDQVEQARAAVDGSDIATARSSIDDAADDLRAAAGSLDQAPWRLWQHLPVVGDDVRAARTVADVGRDLADGPLPDLLTVYDRIDGGGLRRPDGSLDPARITALAAPLGQAAAALREGVDRLDAIDTGAVDARIGERIDDVRATLADSTAVADAAAESTRIVGPMLAGQHSYALLFHNVAELTSNGGLPGAWSQLVVDDGRIEIGRQGAGNQVVSETPVAPVTRDLIRGFGFYVDRDLRAADLIPDFPTAAATQRVLLEKLEEIPVDGVIGIDPVAIASLLRATGPITVGDGIELDADNAAAFLVNEVYSAVPDTTAQDALFAQIVREVFDRFQGDDLSPLDLARAVRDGIDDGRIRVWSADPGLQRRISRTPVAHALPADPQRGLGVYLIDSTQGKMSYYVNVLQRTTARSCDPAGRQTYRTQILLGSQAPADAATTLPDYVLGPGFRPQGSIRMNVVILGPAGGSAPVVTVLGSPTPTRPFEVFGRPASQATFVLAPGESYPITVDTLGPSDQRGDTAFAMTPTIRYAAPQDLVRSACG